MRFCEFLLRKSPANPNSRTRLSDVLHAKACDVFQVRPLDRMIAIAMQLPTSASTDGQLDWLADAAEHFHQRVDGELVR